MMHITTASKATGLRLALEARHSRSEIERMIRTAIIVVVVLLLGGVIYFLGVFSASFQDGICYSDAIHGIAKHAEASIRIGGPIEAQKFDEFLKALPLYGYETNCDELRAAIEANNAVQ
jgi:hypothetical protein